MADNLFQDNDSESDVSLTSTVESEAQDEYLIDRILAERPRYNEDEDEDEDNAEYLVKWTGYSKLRSTWEPKENFMREHDTFEEWEERRTNEQRGLIKPFDIAAWEDDIAEFTRKKERRKAKRASKRKQVAKEKREAAKRLQKRDSVARNARSRTTSENPRSRVGSASDRAFNSDESGSDADGDDDLSSLLRRKRKPSRSPTYREKKRNTASASHTRGLAQRVKRSADGSPLLPDLPADVAEANASQSSFNSLFDSTQGEPHESSTSGLQIRGAAQANGKPPTNKALAFSETANTGTTNKPKAATSKVVNAIESVDTPSRSISSGAGFTIKGAALPVRRTTAKMPPPSKKKSVQSVPTAAPSASPPISAIKPVGKAKVSIEQALAQAKQAKQRADAKKSSSNPPASSTSSRPASSTISGPRRAPPGPARVTGPSVFASWDKNKKRDVRKPASATDPNLFKSLSVQNSIQKWANSERAPDPNALRMVNPKTGEVEQTLRPSVSTSGLRIDTDLGPRTEEHVEKSGSASALGMRSGQPQSAPPGFQVNHNSAAPQQPYTTALNSGLRSAYPAYSPPYGKKGITCPHWKKGHCMYLDNDCEFAHFDTGRSARKRQIVCGHWESGFCKFTAEECLYMHCRLEEMNLPDERTGPGSYFERQYGRREESPDTSGRRQDVIDTRRDKQRKTSRSTIPTPNVATTSSTIKDKGARQVPAPSSRRESLITSNTPLAQSLTLDSITSPSLSFTNLDKVASPSIADSPHLADNLVASPSEMELELMEVLVSLQIRSQKNTTLQSRLVFDSHPSNKEFVTIVGDNVELEAQNICMASDFQKYCFENDLRWASGEMSFFGDQVTQSRFVDYLQLNAAGAIIHNKLFTMVVYPRTEDYWGFLGKHGKPGSSSLRFHVQRVTPDARTYSTSSEEILKPGMSALAGICEKELGLDKSRLFQGNNKKLEKLVFLMFPSRETPEARLITAWLLEMGAIVYNGDVSGAWDKFRQDQKDQTEFGRSGVILFHPSMTQYHEIPQLSLVLFSGSYNLFQLGIDASLKDHSDAAVNYSLSRIFPMSGALLITDDVFEFHPRMAAKVLKTFYEGMSGKPEGAKNDRIVTRPRVKDWLYDLIDKYDGKEDVTDRVWLCHMVANMLPDVDNYGNPLPGGKEYFVVSPRADEHPGYSAMWDRDEESATDWLVEWYAGWCVQERERFRRFTVVHEQQHRPEQTPGVGMEKDPRQWGKKWNHIRVMNCTRWHKGGGKR